MRVLSVAVLVWLALPTRAMADGTLVRGEVTDSTTEKPIACRIYIEGETGVRIEDLVVIDVEAGRMDRVTQFPRDEVVVGV